MPGLSYPPARRGDVVDDYHGEAVADPYRWLEDPDSAETAAFVAAQNELTERYLAQVEDREAIRRRLAELWSFDRYGVPFERGGHWFQFRISAGEDQPVLYLADAPDAAGRALLDPNALSAGGTVSIAHAEACDDGSLLAYATSDAGSDWMTWHVRRVADASDLSDVLHWAKFSGAAWLADGSGFFYSGQDAPEPGQELQAETRFPKIRLHRLGSGQDDDEVVFEAPDEPEWTIHPSVTDDGSFLVLHIARGTNPESEVRVRRLGSGGDGLWHTLVGGFDAVAEVVANVGDRFLVLTDAGADRRRVVAIDLASAAAGLADWHEVVAERPATLVGVHHCGGRLVCHYLEDAHSALSVVELDGTPVRDIPIDGLVSLQAESLVDSVQGRPGSSEVLWSTTGFFDPGTIWSHDLESGATRVLWPSALPLDTSDYLTELEFAESADGTRLPVFVSRRRDVTPSGEAPVLLYAYGGFNVPLMPSFRVAALVFMERGGVFAQAVLRGGGEYGTAWHDAGRLAHKQNVFDDFAACARHFVDTGWSRPGHIAIWGGSNGGLLVGASVNQHPELFGAAVAEVGVFDLLRYKRFTIGWAWTSDFGDPDDARQYPWPRAYSPLHNVRPDGRYPPTLIMTGDHDDRVVPGHSFKYAAAVQSALADDAGPVLLRVETSAGHGHGKPVSKQVAERTDFLAFIEAALGT